MKRTAIEKGNISSGKETNLPDKKLEDIIIGYLIFFIVIVYQTVRQHARVQMLHGKTICSAANNIFVQTTFLCYIVYRVIT